MYASQVAVQVLASFHSCTKIHTVKTQIITKFSIGFPSFRAVLWKKNYRLSLQTLTVVDNLNFIHKLNLYIPIKYNVLVYSDDNANTSSSVLFIRSISVKLGVQYYCGLSGLPQCSIILPKTHAPPPHPHKHTHGKIKVNISERSPPLHLRLANPVYNVTN